jgi:Flp pilus assembly pilin Flp
MNAIHEIHRRAFRTLQNLFRDQSGQDLLEYALLVGLVACVAVAVVPAITSTSQLYSQAMSALSLALASTAGN